MDTWAQGRGTTDIEEVLRAIAPWVPIADGFTISGGEPFDQPDALGNLLARLRALSRADILVFTGYSFEAIGQHLQSANGLIDALITDPFERGAPQTLALRGSDNQRLHLLTDLGRDRFGSYERLSDERDHAVDFMLDEDGTVWLAGIPARHDLQRLQKMLEAGGSRLSISEDHRPDTF